ncbi:Aorsin [Drechslerella dactyloides]|uniref:Aorsin n=1 Tax=Drechslerella dactyloides TaxID=74499 RepID=A0AAD6NF45_DREDA|nr:Aorsin [Drechslerella dactyloides]
MAHRTAQWRSISILQFAMVQLHIRWGVFAVYIVSTIASPVPYSKYVVHESRRFLPQGWERDSRLAANLQVPVKIGLTQTNLHIGEELLLHVSHPDSPSYGKHWTADEVRRKFTPSQESYTAVSTWLRASGIRHTLDARGWISFNTSVAKVKEILRTEYYLYEHTSGQMHIGCESYSLPEEIHTHVDLILPTLHWDIHAEEPSSPKQRSLRRLAKRSKAKRTTGAIVDSLGTGFRSSGARRLTQSDTNHLNKLANPKYATVATCDEAITPDCLRQLYNFGVNHNPMKGNSFAVVSFTPQTYLQQDMDNFFGNFSPIQVGSGPIVKSINGGYVLPQTGDWWNAVETNMDLQYAMSLVYPQDVTLFQVGDGLQGTKEEYNNFLNAIDGTYCNYDGGNDPVIDAVYPDPAAGGYKGTPMCGVYEPSLVLSISYGGNEHDYTRKYAVRQCNEFLKLGLMGVSVLFASGDFGVGGFGSACRDPSGAYNDGLSGRFTPDYPATLLDVALSLHMTYQCPYLTAVGGTYIPLGKTVFDPELAWNTYLPWSGINGSSGGGFSEYFPTPLYQKPALAAYLSANPPPYTSAQYNNSGATRGYPDVAANAWNYTVGIENVLDFIGGTSASTPTFASVVALLNQDRLYRKKSPLGFLNPALYAHPEILNDIKVGNNPGCGTNGFKAATGWDPVTGLGTPNFNKMRSFFGNLP